MSHAEVILGDCREVMRGLPEASVDAIVTDPPYDLLTASRNGSRRTNVGQPGNPYAGGGARAGGFMGKAWDATGVAFEAETWAIALRVLKPGGHLLAFGGTRTFHRLTCAIEDAGFEVRDCLTWLYGSGFPKSHDVSKAIDKASGAERGVVGRGNGGLHHRASVTNLANWDTDHDAVGHAITAPATEAAQAWYGWGTALKPAWEPIVLARKATVGPVARNVLTWGTGALNIEATRVGDLTRYNPPTNSPNAYGGFEMCDGEGTTVTGRWPANVVLDDEVAAELDAEVGESPGGGLDRSTISAANLTYGAAPKTRTGIYAPDYGGPSRYFYTSKASASERQERVRQAGERNTHPTVKPLDLMRWLVRLVTPPGGRVLDPFAGSGTTLVAALNEGLDAVGIELYDEYVTIARARIDGVQTGFDW